MPDGLPSPDQSRTTTPSLDPVELRVCEVLLACKLPARLSWRACAELPTCAMLFACGSHGESPVGGWHAQLSRSCVDSPLAPGVDSAGVLPRYTPWSSSDARNRSGGRSAPRWDKDRNGRADRPALRRRMSRLTPGTLDSARANRHKEPAASPPRRGVLKARGSTPIKLPGPSLNLHLKHSRMPAAGSFPAMAQG
jgi:hypothetical protein